MNECNSSDSDIVAGGSRIGNSTAVMLWGDGLMLQW